MEIAAPFEISDHRLARRLVGEHLDRTENVKCKCIVIVFGEQLHKKTVMENR